MYAKLFASLYQGTLRGRSHALLVFTNLLAHADSQGHVDIHPRAIGDEVGLQVEQVREALALLEAPDEESRSPEMEGRRIVRLDEHRAWGWRVVNYLKYRSIRNEDDRREQNRAAQERWRAAKRVSQDKPTSAEHQQEKPRQPKSAQAEAEAEAEGIKEESGAAQARTPPPPFDGENFSAIPARATVPLAGDFELPEEWGRDAEKLGWVAAAILKESERFRQYWVSGKGAGKRRSLKGWRQSWSNWLGKAERFG